MAAKKRKRKARSVREQIAERLRNAREELQLTQVELAKKAGLGRSTIMHYENAKALPGSMELLKLSKALDISTNHILTGKEQFRKSTDEEFSFDSPESSKIMFRVLFSLIALEPDLRDKFAGLVMGMAQQRVGHDDFSKLVAMSDAIANSIGNVMPDMETVFESHLKDGGLSRLEAEIKALDDAS